jgi:hypothetical protein
MAKQTTDMNVWFENFLEKTLWLWLPFYILFPLLRSAKEKVRKMTGHAS